MAVVVDASALIEFLLEPPRFPRMTHVFDTVAVHAPHLIDAEVLHGIRRYVRTGEVSAERATEILGDFVALPIERHRQTHLLGRMWMLRENLTAYDATYVALAEILDAPLLTRDARLARSRGHTARIEYID